MKRYDKTPLRKDVDGKRYKKFVVYPRIPFQDTDIYIRVFSGERLDILAQKYYSDTTLWWIISKANNLSGNEVQLDPSLTYRIPINTTPILDEYNRINGY